MAPPGGRLHVTTAWRGSRLVAIVPAVSHRRGPFDRLSTMGAGMAVRGVALADRAAGPDDLACLAACAPGRRTARLDLAAVQDDDPLPDALREAWPGRTQPLRAAGVTERVPVVRLHRGYTPWWELRSGAFRQRIARAERRLAADGAEAWMAGPERHGWALEEFLRLHASRWGSRSPLAGDAGRRMMREAAASLGPQAMRIHVLARDNRAIAVHVAVRAGNAAAYWNGGWDPAWARHSPGLVSLTGLVRDAAANGVAAVDLGVGSGYKDHFTRDAVGVRDVSLIPWGLAMPAALAAELPVVARAAAGRGLRRLPAGGQARVRAARRRLRRR
ncbi:MAG: GNAT family N-acetyltransferase, partial [Thermoleophilia bacterium]|nr:GNAT family N-acetyltransferase [Thermoleophilia bacterium]